MRTRSSTAPGALNPVADPTDRVAPSGPKSNPVVQPDARISSEVASKATERGERVEADKVAPVAGKPFSAIAADVAARALESVTVAPGKVEVFSYGGKTFSVPTFSGEGTPSTP